MVFLASAVAPFNQFKVPPLIPVLLRELQLTEIQAGLLMSIFSLSGLILALPAGLLFRQFGPRLVGTLAVASTGIGSAMGALAPDANLLLVSRLVEGIGMGMTAVFAVVTIAAWFPPHRRGIPMGIFTTWIPVGQLLVFLVAPRIHEVWGWRAVWWVGSAASLSLAVLFVLLVRLPAGSAMTRQNGSGVPLTQVMREPGPWILSAVFSCFHLVRAGFATWTPFYLVTVAGWTLLDAASVMTWFYLVSIPAALPAGWLVDRFGGKRWVIFWSYLLSAPALAIAYAIDPSLIVFVIVWLAALAAAITTAVTTATPTSVSSPSLVGPAAGIVGIGRNGGQLLAPLILAPIIQAGLSWNWVAVALVVTLLIGAVGCLWVHDDTVRQ